MRQWIGKHAFIWPVLGSVVLWLLIGAASGKMTLDQLFSCAKLATFALLLGLAQMTVVTSGDGAIDLSQIYTLTLCAYVACSVTHHSNIALGVVAAIGVGALCGLLNGCVNVYFRVPAMITTLANGYIIFSVILIGAPFMKTLPHPQLVSFINRNVLGVSMLTLIAAAFALGLSVLLYCTRYGKWLHATGQNKQAAFFAGIPVRRVTISAFTLAGAICGFAGVLCGAFIGGAFPDMGSTYFLPSVAATFVGGTMASGGKSSVVGVCVGALMMSLMTTFLNAANLAPGIQRLIQGTFMVLILVASVSGASKKR